MIQRSSWCVFVCVVHHLICVLSINFIQRSHCCVLTAAAKLTFYDDTCAKNLSTFSVVSDGESGVIIGTGKKFRLSITQNSTKNLVVEITW